MELKPCPFCGWKADMFSYCCTSSGEALPAQAWVQCMACGAQSNRYGGAGIDDAERKAAEAWNRRANNV